MSTEVSSLLHYTYASPDDPALYTKKILTYNTMKLWNEKYNRADIRRQSLHQYYSENEIEMANCGLYQRNANDKNSIWCIFCAAKFTYNEMKLNYCPKRLHRKMSPLCPYLLHLNVGNIPLTVSGKTPDFDKDLGIKYDNIRLEYEKYKDVEKCKDFEKSLLPDKYLDILERQNTFRRQKYYFKYTYFADSGLYLSDDDKLVCVICKRYHNLDIDGVFKLDSNLYHYKDCKYYRKEIPSNNTKYPIIRKYKIDLSNLNAYIDKLNIPGLNRDIIINKYLYTGKGYDSKYEMILSSYNQPSPPKRLQIQSFVAKNVECIICFKEYVDGVFLPCGHLITCYSCDSQFTTCPKCRSIIDSVVYNIRLSNL